MISPEEANRLENDALDRSLADLRVFIVGGGFMYAKMFYDAGFKGARSVDDADIVCFTGGEDVDPALYGEKPLAETYFNSRRDEIEAAIFGECIGAKKPMIGICRGAQFLNVMNGGKMWQDVNNHTRGHSVVDVRTGEVQDSMTSTHHQMMRPAADAEIIAVASLATHKKAASEESISEEPVENSDTEVVWYPDSLSLCFQPHPEFGHGNCRNYFLSLVDDMVLPAC